jgi:hypothetical protein
VQNDKTSSPGGCKIPYGGIENFCFWAIISSILQIAKINELFFLKREDKMLKITVYELYRINIIIGGRQKK